MIFIRPIAALILYVAVAAAAVAKSATPPAAPGCYAVETAVHAFTGAAAKDKFVVEVLGQTCPVARVLVYVETAEGRLFPLTLAKLADFAEHSPIDQSAANAAAKEVVSRIDSSMQLKLESWAELEKAGTQPDGAPWRGTPLSKPDYERFLKAKPRFIIVPSDFTRNKLVVWDAEGARPVDFVHFGD